MAKQEDGLIRTLLRKFGLGRGNAHDRIAEAAATGASALDLDDLNLESLPSEIGQLTALRSHRHLALDVGEAAGAVLRYNSDEAPRIYSLRPVETSRLNPLQLVGRHVEITIWCEELKAPVDGATRIVTLDPVWLGHLREHGATLHRLVSTAAIMGATVKAVRGIATADLDKLREATGEIVKAAMHWDDGAGRDKKDARADEDRSGRPIAQEFGTPVEAEVAADLRKAAENGQMKQIAINNVWSWVCPAVANRNDPNVAKEKA